MRRVDVTVCGRSYRTAVAVSFLQALRGVHGVTPDVEAIVIPGSSVHGFTLRAPMWVCGVHESGEGLGWRLLRPGRVARFPGANAVIEFPRGVACENEHRSHTILWAG